MVGEIKKATADTTKQDTTTDIQSFQQMGNGLYIGKGIKDPSTSILAFANSLKARLEIDKPEGKYSIYITPKVSENGNKSNEYSIKVYSNNAKMEADFVAATVKNLGKLWSVKAKAENTLDHMVELKVTPPSNEPIEFSNEMKAIMNKQGDYGLSDEMKEMIAKGPKTYSKDMQKMIESSPREFSPEMNKFISDAQKIRGEYLFKETINKEINDFSKKIY